MEITRQAIHPYLKTITEPNRTKWLAYLKAELAKLPPDWHGAGTVSANALNAIIRHSRNRTISHSVETGSGKTTLLLSHLSRDHKVFAKENENRSITVARESPLLNRNTVQIYRRSYTTDVPRHQFENKLQFVLLDGPHGYPFPELECYSLYPQLETDGVLVVDDIHIPTIYRMFEFLREDEMFRLLEVIGTTAFLSGQTLRFFPHVVTVGGCKISIANASRSGQKFL